MRDFTADGKNLTKKIAHEAHCEEGVKRGGGAMSVPSALRAKGRTKNDGVIKLEDQLQI